MKHIILALLAALLLLSLVSCGSKEEAKDSSILSTEIGTDAKPSGPNAALPEEDDEAAVSEEVQAPSPETEVQPTGEKYESALLGVYGSSANHKDNFAGLVGHVAPSLLTADGNLYSAPYDWEDIPWFSSEELLCSLVSFEGNVGYYDDLGQLHIWDRAEYICSEFIGEPIWSFRGMLDGCLYLFSREGDRVYVNAYKENGYKNGGYDNLPLSIYDYKNKRSYETFTDVQIRVANGNTHFYVETTEGTVFFDTFLEVAKRDGKARVSLDPIDPKMAIIFDYGYNYSFTSALYAESEDDVKLTFTEGWSSDPLYLHLPDGYTAADVKEALFGALTVVSFEDGSVWAGELNHTVTGTSLVKSEELTSLMQQGVIRELHLSSDRDKDVSEYSLLVLCDDNVIYEVSGDSLVG